MLFLTKRINKAGCVSAGVIVCGTLGFTVKGTSI